MIYVCTFKAYALSHKRKSIQNRMPGASTAMRTVQLL